MVSRRSSTVLYIFCAIGAIATSSSADAFVPSKCSLSPSRQTLISVTTPPPRARTPPPVDPRPLSTQPTASTSRLYVKTPTEKGTKKAKEEEESLSSSFDKALHKYRVLLRCQLAIVAYMAVGVLAFSRIFEQWPVLDSLYFSVVTFTTVGYGDLVPSTEAGKLFTILYSFSGIAIVGALLGYVGGTVVEAERAAIRKTRAAARAAIMELFDPNKKKGGSGPSARVSQAVEDSVNDDNGGSSVGTGRRLPGLGVLRNILSGAFALRTRRDGSKSLLRKVFDTFADSYYIFVPFLSLAFVMGKAEGWTGITSMYYALATATTVGYGDVSPSSPRMRLLSLAFIPLAVISLGEILGRIAGYFIHQESTRAEREFMDRRLTLDDLEAMDTDADGKVDLFEFLTFMLGSMQKVDKELMFDLKALFAKLDASGDGYLETEDLVLIARKKRDPWSLRRKREAS